MSEKALQFAKDEILRTITAHFSDISEQEAIRLSDELLDVIDWSNPALMHKSISWITKSYLKNRISVYA